MRKESLPLFCANVLFAILGGTALADDVTSVAGTGAAGFSGDGGPATAAALHFPRGLAVAADGTVYFADSVNLRIRSLSPTGTIATIAGSGAMGDTGDGDLATAATISGVFGVALNPTTNVLYFGDLDNNRVRQVDLDTGIISSFAGGGAFSYGFGGDGDAAADAWLAFPEGVAVGPDGDVYIADLFNNRVRRVDSATGIISTFAGDGGMTSAGDGGLATAASLAMPRRVAVDGVGNVFVLDRGTPALIRRVDAVSNVITTIAGGGATTPGTGPATSMNLGEPSDIALDGSGQLFIANATQVYGVDLASGTLSVLGGTGAAGFSGDGGPAVAATFNDIFGLAVRATTGDLLVADAGNQRIRAIAPNSTSIAADLIVELATSQSFLDAVTHVEDSVFLVNVGGREFLVMPNLADVGDSVIATGNAQLLVVDLAALAAVGGSIDISGNLALTTLDLSALGTVGGNLNIADNPNLSAILIAGITSIDFDLTIVNTAATMISLPALASVGGKVDISSNSAAASVNLESLATVGGSIAVANNAAATGIDLGSLTTAGGSVSVTGNSSATGVDLASLQTAGGDVAVSGNTAATHVDLGSLTATSGAVSITGNTAATDVDLGSLTTAGGSVSVTGNSSATQVDLSSLASAAGDVTVESAGTGTFVAGNAAQVSGGLDLDLSGYDSVTGNTAHGSTTLSNATLDARMTVQLPALSFATPTAFILTRLDPATLLEETGTAAGAEALVDPVAAYHFGFATPTLDQAATLTFDLRLAGLDAATQADVLAALDAGLVTLATRADAPGSLYQAFPVCAAGDLPTVDGCVLIARLDGNGVPTGATPAIVRFSNVVGHLSGWGVVIVTPIDRTPPVFSLRPAVTAEATGPAGAAVGYSAPSASDDTDGPVAVSCTPASGATFPLGASSVTCAASDAAGNAATASFAVTVVDTTAPALRNVPRAMTLSASSPAGAVATWPAPTAGDLVSGSVPVACSPASDSTFAIGTTTVTCAAADAAGNAATATFAVTVQPLPSKGTMTVCDRLGDESRWWLDMDLLSFRAAAGEQVKVTLAANPAGGFKGNRATLMLSGARVFRYDASTLPNVLTSKLTRTGIYYIGVSQTFGRGAFNGAYCVTVESSQGAAGTLQRH